MSVDDQVRQIFDRALVGARSHLEADLRTFAHDLARVAADERGRAVQQAAENAAAEAHRQADAQIAQLRESSQRHADELRRAGEAQLTELKSDLNRQLEEAERSSQVRMDEIRLAAQAQIEEAQRAAQAQIDEAHRSAEAADESRRLAQAEAEQLRRAVVAAEEARRVAEAQVEAARHRAQAEIDDGHQLAQAQLEEIQSVMTTRLEDTRRDLESQLDATRRQSRAELDQARAELESSKRAAQAEAEQVLTTQLAIAAANTERMVAEAIERARADEAANVGLVVEALRRMDGARSLGEVLGILAESAGQHADRAAVLLVKGDRLRAWRLAGFDVRDPIDLAVDNAGVAGSVVRTGTAATQAPADMTSMERAEQGGLPPFAEGAGARTALAVPLVVGGITVAVLYADAVSSPSSALANRWSPAVEVLCRYASRALEATTLARATGVNVPRSVAPASHGAMPGSVDPAHA